MGTYRISKEEKELFDSITRWYALGFAAEHIARTFDIEQTKVEYFISAYRSGEDSLIEWF